MLYIRLKKVPTEFRFCREQFCSDELTCRQLHRQSRKLPVSQQAYQPHRKPQEFPQACHQLRRQSHKLPVSQQAYHQLHKQNHNPLQEQLLLSCSIRKGLKVP